MKPIPTETATDVGSVGKWLGAAAAGALLMYLLDPERGSARRSRAMSALRTASARTGATVDHALHSAGDRLVDLKDSAASALSRGADRLHAQAAPMLERARHGVQDATQRMEDSADRARAWSHERSAYDSGRSPARYSSYESNRHYDSDKYGDTSYDSRARGGLAGWLRGLGLGGGSADYGGSGAHPALVGGGVLGLLSLMRRSPGGLLVGLAGLALLMQGTRDKTYRVSDNMHELPRSKRLEQHGQAPLVGQGEQAGSRYLH